MTSPNVLELPLGKSAVRENPSVMLDVSPERQAVVVPLDRAPNDDAMLKRAAPWLEQEFDVIDEWRRCPFMSHLSRQLAASLTPTAVENMRWKVGPLGIGASVATPAGNVRITSGRAGVRFEGQKDALVSAGVAHPDWLHAGPRGGPANRFEIVTFGAARRVTIHRCKERYSVTYNFTDEEAARHPENVCEEHAKTKKRAINALNSLPTSPSEFLQSFADVANFIVDGLEVLALESKGGYSLSDRSRGDFLTKLHELRQAAYRATSTFNYDERRAAIDGIAQKHAPSTPPILSTQTT